MRDGIVESKKRPQNKVHTVDRVSPSPSSSGRCSRRSVFSRSRCKFTVSLHPSVFFLTFLLLLNVSATLSLSLFRPGTVPRPVPVVSCHVLYSVLHSKSQSNLHLPFFSLTPSPLAFSLFPLNSKSRQDPTPDFLHNPRHLTREDVPNPSRFTIHPLPPALPSPASRTPSTGLCVFSTGPPHPALGGRNVFLLSFLFPSLPFWAPGGLLFLSLTSLG